MNMDLDLNPAASPISFLMDWSWIWIS